MHNAKNYVLIPAAGSGSRMGAELPKQYLPLLGKPMIHHTLSVFCIHPDVSRVFVVLSPDDSGWEQYNFASLGDKVEVLRCGGETRAESVLNGLDAIQGRTQQDDWVLVHDAARPCLTQEMLDRLLGELAEDAVGGLLAVPVADTLKREGKDGRVDHTEPRAGLWRAQTPQMFRYGLLREALQAIGTDTPTDEAQAVEFLGHAPRLVMGDGHNLKVTYPEDLVIAELLLKNGNE
jgi:2-C-methyl-D-erythritol 4-phosphate cytidylyltransferase